MLSRNANRTLLLKGAKNFAVFVMVVRASGEFLRHAASSGHDGSLVCPSPRLFLTTGPLASQSRLTSFVFLSPSPVAHFLSVRTAS